jgi:hypothetical protein
LIDKKNKIEKELTNMLSTYLYKYIKHIYGKVSDSKSKYPDFQRRLLSISDWSNNTIEKEYKKFLKWCYKKYKLSQTDLEYMFKDFILITVKIITKSILNLDEYPKLQNMYYKSLKKFSRFYYENPKEIKDFDSNDDHLKSIIKHKLSTFIPIKQVVNILESIENQDKSDVSYDFDDEKKTLSEEYDNRSKNSKLIVEKINSDGENDLRYISSDEFNNEYYQSGDDNDANDDKNGGNEKISHGNHEDDDIKYIHVPKNKKKYDYNKPKPVDEIRENFFTDE